MQGLLTNFWRLRYSHNCKNSKIFAKVDFLRNFRNISKIIDVVIKRVNYSNAHSVCVYQILFVTLQRNNKNNNNMENETLYSINIDLNKNVIISFIALNLQTDDDTTGYFRTDDGKAVNSMGFVRIDEKNNMVGFLYDIFAMNASIKSKREADGMVCYHCTNDLIESIDFYIAERTIWLEKGQSFYRH